MKLFAGKGGKCRARERTSGHSVGGTDETNGESSVNINTLPGVRWIGGEKVLVSTGSPAWHSIMTWKGGMGEWEIGEVCITMADTAITVCMPETNATLQVSFLILKYIEQLFIITSHIKKTNGKMYVHYRKIEYLSTAFSPQEFGEGNKMLHYSKSKFCVLSKCT